MFCISMHHLYDAKHLTKSFILLNDVSYIILVSTSIPISAICTD